MAESSDSVFSAEYMKVCRLCGALNSQQNSECFVYRWSGQFDTDQEAIDKAVEELLRTHRI